VTIVSTTPEATPKRKRNNSFWREMPILLGAAIVVAILVRTFVLQTFYVPSGSMEHTLNVNDRVLVNKLAYDFRDPKPGEVIVFNSPVSWRDQPDEKVFVKRMIGAPGDHVVCCNAQGQMSINGVALDETYLSRALVPGPAAPEPFDIVVPAGRLWVMGDNRGDSDDSLHFYEQSHQNITEGTIPISSVIGRAVVLVWPVKRATWLTVPKAFANVPAPAPPA
jgi:signal peptidase I